MTIILFIWIFISSSW